ncbi:MAG: sugar ABC transporter substrate-binding protein [Propionibacteriaceae bacterium]|jgi:multiple sugar transport system substrate-binding protein|nr:sugar ABC transporter substrate-binding protein [Propionibacteriaceae bacterium]
MSHRPNLALAALAVVAGLALTGCGGSPAPAPDTSDAPVELTFRTWDETAAAAYETSFADFTAAHPGITVKTEVVGWSDYFAKVRTDVAGNSAPDLYWLNNSNLQAYAQSGKLVDISAALADAVAGWDQPVVQQFTLDGTLWGVPQTSDGGIAVYYNADLLAAAGLTEADIADLAWSPDGGADSLLATARKLTLDAAGHSADQPDFDPATTVQWGYNAAQDLQAIYLPFIGSNGGAFQSGDAFTLTDPKTVAAFGYIVDLINQQHVAPSAADTNANGDFSRDQFLQGKIGLFQSGLYNLAQVADNADFEWGVVGLPQGPAGAVSVSNGIAVVGNAQSAHPDELAQVLAWLGSEAGNTAIGASGANLPAVTAAQQTYRDYWSNRQVDLTPFFTVLDSGVTIPAPTGAKFNDAYAAYKPILDEVFLGRVPVAEGLEAANTAANSAANA